MGADGGSKKEDPLSDESLDRGTVTVPGGQSRIVSISNKIRQIDSAHNKNTTKQKKDTCVKNSKYND